MSRHRRRRRHGKAFGFSGLKPACHDKADNADNSNSSASASAPSESNDS
jgi:hypothetical protein